MIHYDYDNDMESTDGWVCKKIYNDVEPAKQYLKNLYDTCPDYKHYGYRIMVYILENNEYVFTHKIYTYNPRFDTFDYLDSDD